MNFTSRHHKFDSGHRVLYNNSKCKNLHGHEYRMEATFGYNVSTIKDHIGYPIDFGEIKRVFFDWIDNNLDHGFLVNPTDLTLIDFLKTQNSKLYIMSIGNPSAENIAKELFYIGDYLLKDRGLIMSNIKLYETTNCYVECTGLQAEELEFLDNKSLNNNLQHWKDNVGIKNYDSRYDLGANK